LTDLKPPSDLLLRRHLGTIDEVSYHPKAYLCVIPVSAASINYQEFSSYMTRSLGIDDAVCAPNEIVLIQREERRILNTDAIVKQFAREGFKNVSVREHGTFHTREETLPLSNTRG
jgi:hypothetical protein